MNKWVKRSIDLANTKNYLDLLFDIYLVSEEQMRELLKESRVDIVKNYNKKDKVGLIQSFFKLKKFPINDPYIASLRKYPFLIVKNPKTIDRIGRKLFSIKINNLLKLVIQAKSPSRQFGQSFQKWLQGIGYPFLEEKAFKVSKEAVFLKGSDEKLKQFADRELGLKGLNRRPDFILRAKNKFIIGEAKFLSDYGGTQNNQFDGAIKITKISGKNIEGVAILDGIVWFKSNTYTYKKVKKTKGVALSAILLGEFIKDLV
jgi:hypothetical protein